MKKYLFSFLAVVFAVAMVAFTKPQVQKENVTSIYFEYTESSYLEGDVTDIGHWREIPSLGGCESGSELACQIEVPIEFTEGEPGERTLEEGVVIDAAEFDDDKFYVVTNAYVSSVANRLE